MLFLANTEGKGVSGSTTKQIVTQTKKHQNRFFSRQKSKEEREREEKERMEGSERKIDRVREREKGEKKRNRVRI